MRSTNKFASGIIKYAAMACACFFIFPLSEGFAQHCKPYWTAAYKCANGCGCPGGGGGGGGGGGSVYVPPQPSAAQIAARRATALTIEGNKAYTAYNWTLAISLYEQALRLNPHSGVIAGNLRHVRANVLSQEGIDAHKAGNLTVAASLFERALRLIPNDYPIDKGRIADNLKKVRAQQQNLRGAEAELRAQKQNAERQSIGTAQSIPAKNISSEWVCPPDLPKIASNPARFDQPDGHYCIGKSSIACGGPSKSWACEADRSCNGDGSDPKVALCR